MGRERDGAFIDFKRSCSRLVLVREKRGEEERKVYQPLTHPHATGKSLTIPILLTKSSLVLFTKSSSPCETESHLGAGGVSGPES